VNAKDFFPIAVGKVLPNHPRAFTPVLEPARAMPCYAGQDEMADYSQTMPRPAVPADPDDYFSEADDDYDDALEVRELLAQRPAPTPNGKWVALAMDACAQIMELQRLIGELNFFSAGDTGLGRLCQQAEKAKDVLIRAGMRGVL
jgi:hypothetical protein